MTAEVFDGVAAAARREEDLRKKLEVFFANKREQLAQLPPDAVSSSQQILSLKIAAIAFTQDDGSRIYSEVKAAAALRLGIVYELHEFLFTAPLDEVTAEIEKLNRDDTVTGIIVQKPWRRTYENYTDGTVDFAQWWHTLIGALRPEKDVDGLTGRGRVPPATCAAVLSIMDLFQFYSPQKALIIGRSDLLGLPLYKKMQELGWGEKVQLVGRPELQVLKARPEKLTDFTLIVSATGVHNLITGDEISADAILIDVGEPQSDFEFESCREKARFMTTVPGGVGPLTVISLLENCLELVKD
jgi:methylenetetrahydrofolate dehydrogenase (NADP+)/methenyltetrahydrofolate cyclohydrolase